MCGVAPFVNTRREKGLICLENIFACNFEIEIFVQGVRQNEATWIIDYIASVLWLLIFIHNTIQEIISWMAF